MVRQKPAPRDFFGNFIEVGDKYFYGAPTVTGVVCKIRIKSIEIEEILKGRRTSMNCKSPDKGICLDKIPGQGVTVYKVTWKMWKGVEPCGKADYSHHKQLFSNLEEATSCFEAKRLHHNGAKLAKITTELLEESDD